MAQNEVKASRALKAERIAEMERDLQELAEKSKALKVSLEGFLLPRCGNEMDDALKVIAAADEQIASEGDPAKVAALKADRQGAILFLERMEQEFRRAEPYLHELKQTEARIVEMETSISKAKASR